MQYACNEITHESVAEITVLSLQQWYSVKSYNCHNAVRSIHSESIINSDTRKQVDPLTLSVPKRQCTIPKTVGKRAMRFHWTTWHTMESECFDPEPYLNSPDVLRSSTRP